jgi:hypothetical protein
MSLMNPILKPDDAPLPEEVGNNRTFLIAVGILGGIILISIACLVGVYLFGSQNQPAQLADEAATQTALANTLFIDQALTATANASILPTATLEPTATSVVSLPPPLVRLTRMPLPSARWRIPVHLPPPPQPSVQH